MHPRISAHRLRALDYFYKEHGLRDRCERRDQYVANDGLVLAADFIFMEQPNFMNLNDWLSELERVEKAATPGEIESISAECPECHAGWAAVTIYNGKKEVWSSIEDQQLFVTARNALQKLLAIIRVQQEALEELSSEQMDCGLSHDDACCINEAGICHVADAALATAAKIAGGEK